MDTLKTQLVAGATKLIPESTAPQWYFAFLVLGGVGAIVGVKWVESRKRRSRGEPPTESFPVRPATDPRSNNCGECGRRLDKLEADVGGLYDLFREEGLRQEQRLGDLLRQHASEQNARDREFQKEVREEVRGQLAATESRMAREMERMVAQVGQMFLKTQDGVSLPGPFPHQEITHG